MEEQWKPIQTWEDKYEISNYGRVWSKARHIFKLPDTNNCGYLRIQLSRNGNKERYFIHRLVAELFVPGKFADFVVNHIDGNKLNNMATNLEWVSQTDNQRHSLLDLGNKAKLKLFTEQPYKLVHADGTMTYYESMAKLAYATGFSRAMLYNLLKCNDGYISRLNATIVRCESNDYPR